MQALCAHGARVRTIGAVSVLLWLFGDATQAGPAVCAVRAAAPSATATALPELWAALSRQADAKFLFARVSVGAGASPDHLCAMSATADQESDGAVRAVLHLPEFPEARSVHP